MFENFLIPTLTTFTVNGGSFDLQVAYQVEKPNILLAFIDNNADGIIDYREQYIDVEIDIDGNLIVTSFFDDEANSYSLDENGNLIYIS